MERKVILNGCFGGYGWSKQGVIEVLKAKGFRNLHFWIIDLSGRDYIEVTKQRFLSDRDWMWYVVTDGTDINDDFDRANMYGTRDLNREDSEAIQVLEERGSEFCSGNHASLYIETFDDEYFEYSIDEYDGSESLETFPRLTRDQVLGCKSVSDVADILEKIGVIKKPA